MLLRVKKSLLRQEILVFGVRNMHKHWLLINSREANVNHQNAPVLKKAFFNSRLIRKCWSTTTITDDFLPGNSSALLRNSSIRLRVIFVFCLSNSDSCFFNVGFSEGCARSVALFQLKFCL